MEFLDLLESIQQDAASAANLFGNEGTPIRAARRNSPRYKMALLEATKFVADIFAGRRHPNRLIEVMSTDDFPLLFGDILDRQVLANYREWPSTWPQIARRVTVNDFRPAQFDYSLLGGDTRLSTVEELEEYPEAERTERAPVTWSVKKYGRTMGFSWEAMINDNLDRLKDIPEVLGRAARRTETRFVVEMYVDANGPHATLYSNTNGNIINTTNGASANNPPLSIAGLQDAFLVLSKLVDPDTGEPILVDMVTLVVPPALEIVARNILNAIQLEITAASAGGVRDNGTTGEQRLIVQNWMRNRLELAVEPYIPLTATTANGNTSWFLFANPAQGRAAIRVGFLRGHEEPEIFLRSSNALRVGGGESPPLNGDFEHDAMMYKIRHVLGGVTVDPLATVASNGSGS